MITLKCKSCGSRYVVYNDVPVYGCRNRYIDKDVSHILEKSISPSMLDTIRNDIYNAIKIGHSNYNPFINYKKLFFSYYLALHLNIDFDEIVNKIDNNLKLINNGCGFTETPLVGECSLSDFDKSERSKDITVHIKNETCNISGSHKSRHLMGNMIYFDILYKSKIFKDKPKLAIYSCGNAAMAASIVAKAANYELNTYIPPDVNSNVLNYLKSFNAKVIPCPRDMESNQDGDPCYIEFQKVITNNLAIPFSCSGIDNWSNIEGGQTLCLEYISQLLRRGTILDGIVIQVGGGALASSAIQILNELYRLKIINKIPKIYVTQTRGGFPVIRAYYLIVKKIAEMYNINCTLRYNRGQDTHQIIDYISHSAEEIKIIADFVEKHYNSLAIQNFLREILDENNVKNYMWSWEEEPKSIAHGILDDVTYDWTAIIHGMLKTGGIPVIIDEDDIINDNQLARKITGINVDYTGSSGLSGLVKLNKLNLFTEDIKNIATIFTGISRV